MIEQIIMTQSAYVFASPHKVKGDFTFCYTRILKTCISTDTAVSMALEVIYQAIITLVEAFYFILNFLAVDVTGSTRLTTLMKSSRSRPQLSRHSPEFSRKINSCSWHNRVGSTLGASKSVLSRPTIIAIKLSFTASREELEILENHLVQAGTRYLGKFVWVTRARFLSSLSGSDDTTKTRPLTTRHTRSRAFPATMAPAAAAAAA